MFLVVGNKCDPTLSYFSTFLRSNGTQFDTLLLDEPFYEGKLHFELSGDGLRVRQENRWISFSEYKGIYNRLYIPPSVGGATMNAAYRLMSVVAGFLETSNQVIIN